MNRGTRVTRMGTPRLVAALLLAACLGLPAMAGAQGGLGAQAGPPQGGIGVQGSDLSPPRDASKPQRSQEVAPPRDSTKPGSAQEVTKPRDTSLASDERSAVKKSKRAAKRTVKRSRTGVGEIDTTSRSQ